MPAALYRRYRPESFAELIGQDHVTEPLSVALRNDRVNHAYLFSGPRGCGKTTSARILARCLNCEQGPTDTPCGQCDSCRALAREGAGSVDVVEIDAASHGGVDDARELREKAFFAPATSRYKIYIIDEAHMVSSAGFNALLKLVEEPPDHIKFIFATTEPEKVIGTIRSRTHHYPFRLVPPGTLSSYLAQVCEQENVQIEPGVLPLVTRAGGGSVRDSLSVLDQLLAGATNAGVTYQLALALLGYTDATLLDDAVEAFAAHDGAAVFGVVDRVMEAGADPRRFTEDLLQRLRDLIVVSATDSAEVALFGEATPEQVERMRQQAGLFGPAQLTRAAEILNDGLTQMRGATAPRLHLELLCARVLLPALEDTERGLAVRVERLEQRLAVGGVPVASAGGAVAPSESEPAPTTTTPAASKPGPLPDPAAVTPSDPPVPVPAYVTPLPTPEPPTATAPPTTAAAPGTTSFDVAAVRRAWPQVLEELKSLRRFTWTLVSQNAAVAAIDADRLTLAFVNAGARDRFLSGENANHVRTALATVLGLSSHIEAIVDPSAKSAAGGGNGTSAATPAPPLPPTAAVAPVPMPDISEETYDDEPSLDDPTIEAESSVELLQKNLGAQIIEEIVEQSSP